ncbi:MAG: hypothetical protein ABSF43_09820 [Rectinemataceae bacterium]|jgi:hypothetical protein
MRRRIRLGFCLFLAFGLALSTPAALRADIPAGAAAPAILDDDPAGLLGLSLGDSFSRFGAPTSVCAIRGDSAWQDDVAFVYSSGYTLFLYNDRLWQLRFTEPYIGSIYGLFLGDSSGKALSILGQPYENGSGFLLYRMPYKSYPVRLRLALQEDRITDAYLYRADF